MGQINYIWRLGATGLAFAFIFFGGGFLAVTMLPLLSLIPGDRRERAQLVIHILFRFYLSALTRAGIIGLEIEGAEELQAPGGRLLIANHPSLLDVVILMAMVPRAQCIVKHELWDHCFLGPLMRRAGYIRNDLDPEQVMAACQNSLARGEQLIIFPEGTRTKPGEKPQFHRGFANLATLTCSSIQPVVITCDPPTLIKGEPWWRIPPRPPLFRIVVDKTLDASSYLGYPYRSIAARKLMQSIERFYSEKLGYVGSGTGNKEADY